MSKSGSDLFKNTAGANRALVDELVSSGEKVSPEKIVGITRIPSGKIVWMESGNQKSGLQHILNEHEAQFNKQGVSTEKIPNYVIEAVKQGNIVGTQGSGANPRTVYEFIYEGTPRQVAVQIGSNGYIVSANPKSMKGNKK